jgi:hypothetical protein
MRRLGPTLIAAGAVVWTAGVAAWVSGVWVTLPPDTVRVLVLGLAASTGAALVGAGAVISRARHSRNSTPLQQQPDALAQLPEAERSGFPSPIRGPRSGERVT